MVTKIFTEEGNYLFNLCVRFLVWRKKFTNKFAGALSCPLNLHAAQRYLISSFKDVRLLNSVKARAPTTQEATAFHSTLPFIIRARAPLNHQTAHTNNM